MLAGQEAERLRIAQELHDQVGQTLTAVLLLLSRLHTRAPAELHPDLLETQDSARASLEDLRRIAIELRPEALDDLGLESALARPVRPASRSGRGWTCRSSHRRATAPISPETELVIYRVAQEALTNVARHSGSERRRAHACRPATAGSSSSSATTARACRATSRPAAGCAGCASAPLVGAALRSTTTARRGNRVRLDVPIGGRRRDPAEDADPARRRPRRRPARPADGARRTAGPGGRGRGRRRRRRRVERALQDDVDLADPRHHDAAHDRPAGRARAPSPPAQAADPDPLDARERALPLRGAQGRRVRLRR